MASNSPSTHPFSFRMLLCCSLASFHLSHRIFIAVQTLGCIVCDDFWSNIMPSGLWSKNFINFHENCRVEIMVFLLTACFIKKIEVGFSVSAAFSVSDSLLHICSNYCNCHNVIILLSLLGVTSLSLLAGVCAACMLAYRCLQMKWWAAVTVLAISSQKPLLMCSYFCSSKFRNVFFSCPFA